ncbi:MAG TPA: hypothetical protein VGG48_06850 [Rhizomicrobium sp.]|jgi:hypothetical protein
MMSGNPKYPVATASVSWFYPAGSLHIRVYSSDGYNVIERCIDQGGSGWTTGSFSEPGAQVSATAWVGANGPSIRVYCTLDDVTTEWANDPGTGWVKGSYTTT